MSERLPSLQVVPRPKRRAGSEIQVIYRDNQRRLLTELAKDPQDRWTKNNVAAYRHILYWLEEQYDLSA